MWREGLSPDTGMLFVYENEQPRSFWMKNTRIPLSIAYINSREEIVRITDMIPLSDRPVPSGEPALYALEMRKGWFEEHGQFPAARYLELPLSPEARAAASTAGASPSKRSIAPP